MADYKVAVRDDSFVISAASARQALEIVRSEMKAGGKINGNPLPAGLLKAVMKNSKLNYLVFGLEGGVAVSIDCGMYNEQFESNPDQNPQLLSAMSHHIPNHLKPQKPGRRDQISESDSDAGGDSSSSAGGWGQSPWNDPDDPDGSYLLG